MYRFITAFIALSVCYVISPVSGNGTFSSDDNDTADWVGEKPTDTPEYKNMGIHQYSGSLQYAYKSVCESGEGAFTSVLSADESQIYMACINPYKQWLPNSNNTKNQIFRVTVSDDTPMALRKDGTELKFSAKYIQLVAKQCENMNYSYENNNDVTLACGSAAVAMGLTTDQDDVSLYNTAYWDNVDPTQTNEFINDGIFELVEQGQQRAFCEKCERNGVGKCVYTDYDVETFAVACLNSNKGKWLPNPENMADGGHQVVYDATVPTALRGHDPDYQNAFDGLYMTFWEEHCLDLDGRPAEAERGTRLICVATLAGGAPVERASADESDQGYEELRRQVKQHNDTGASATNSVAKNLLDGGLSGGLADFDNQHLNNVNAKMVKDGCTSYERVQSMSYDEFFNNCITSLSEIAVLQQKYEAARANEIRLGNRLLGGLTMAATGAGGMMLGMGLAEQRADREAEERMRGYLSTFRCGYGGAKNIEYSTEATVLPTSSELTNLYAEYVTLANDLKSRKAQLGLRPGIESEPILDSATSGLYDDVSSGRASGTFTSLARAILDPDGEDAQKWAEQTKKSKNLVISGATVGGAGAVGGAVGNLLINKDAYGLGQKSGDSN